MTFYEVIFCCDSCGIYASRSKAFDKAKKMVIERYGEEDGGDIWREFEEEGAVDNIIVIFDAKIDMETEEDYLERTKK